MKLVLGLTGPNAAGKGEAVAHLEKRGFRVHSLSDIVREEAATRGLPPEREHLIRIGNLLRETDGPGALALRILPRLGTRDAVDSIRNPAEVSELRSLPYFVLVGIRAAVELRFERSCKRGRAGDPVTLAEFRRREAQENSRDPNAQQLQATFLMSDRVIDNDAGLAALRRALDDLVDSYEDNVEG